jgi:hypothetical protein
MQWDLLEADSDLWPAALRELRHDFYHLPEYVRLSVSVYEGGQPRAFVARDADGLFLLPMTLRPIEIDGEESSLFDAISPYGYASPLLSVRPGVDEARFLDRAINALVECLMRARVVSLFCRLHPLLELPQQPLVRRGVVMEHGPTVYCDLHKSADELWKGTRETVRRQIRRIQAQGMVAEEDPTWRYYDAFQEVYAQTMRRVGATEWYFFDRDHFDELRRVLADRMHLIVVRQGDKAVCAGLFAETCGIVQYHLAGTGDGYEKSDASKLLIHYARQWGQERGNDVLHLGGGVGAAHDSLLHFKMGFSKVSGTFRTWRLIVDETTYHDLVARNRARAAIVEPPKNNFFPEYRIDYPKATSTAEQHEVSALRR